MDEHWPIFSRWARRVLDHLLPTEDQEDRFEAFFAGECRCISVRGHLVDAGVLLCP